MRFHHFALLLILICFGCTPKEYRNRFDADPDQLTIARLQDSRKTDSLIQYFGNENAVLRTEAALAFGSVQDTGALKPLINLLKDQEPEVRSATAFALGQLYDNRAEQPLIEAFDAEQDLSVANDYLRALGKCGSPLSLMFLVECEAGTNNLLTPGIAEGLYRTALRGNISEDGTVRILELLDPKYPEEARFYAAHYLARTRSLDLTAHEQQIINRLEAEPNYEVQLALTLALGKSNGPQAPETLKNLLATSDDSGIRVMALRAASGKDVEGLREAVWNLVNDSIPQVSEQAATWIVQNGLPENAELYLENSKRIQHWKARALILGAAIRFGPKTSAITDLAGSLYQGATDPYEKGAILSAIGMSPAGFYYLLHVDVSAEHPFVQTAALDALTQCRFHADFDSYWDESDEKDVLLDDFMGELSLALNSKDVGLISLAAGALRVLELDEADKPLFIEKLRKARFSLTLPRDVEACNEINRTLAQLEGTTYEPCTADEQPESLNWAKIKLLHRDLIIHIHTTKGTIKTRMFVERAPGSVVNFVQLIQSGFYHDFSFHRVVPGFVIQDGCPRGDGWGSPEDEFVRSEFSELNYKAGMLGMASAGKDTESSQWFITHVPTPHLDGRYTIFGEVIEGMDVVQRIAVGDKITGYVFESQAIRPE